MERGRLAKQFVYHICKMPLNLNDIVYEKIYSLGFVLHVTVHQLQRLMARQIGRRGPTVAF